MNTTITIIQMISFLAAVVFFCLSCMEIPHAVRGEPYSYFIYMTVFVSITYAGEALGKFKD